MEIFSSKLKTIFLQKITIPGNFYSYFEHLEGTDYTEFAEFYVTQKKYQINIDRNFSHS
jgi:hypothetical protein